MRWAAVIATPSYIDLPSFTYVYKFLIYSAHANQKFGHLSLSFFKEGQQIYWWKYMGEIKAMCKQFWSYQGIGPWYCFSTWSLSQWHGHLWSCVETANNWGVQFNTHSIVVRIGHEIVGETFYLGMHLVGWVPAKVGGRETSVVALHQSCNSNAQVRCKNIATT